MGAAGGLGVGSIHAYRSMRGRKPWAQNLAQIEALSRKSLEAPQHIPITIAGIENLLNELTEPAEPRPLADSSLEAAHTNTVDQQPHQNA